MAVSPAPRANYGLPTPPFWEEGAEGRQRQNDVDFDFEAQKKRAEGQAEEAPEGRKVSFLSPFQEKTQGNAELPAEAPLNMLAASAILNRQIRAITKRCRQLTSSPGWQPPQTRTSTPSCRTSGSRRRSKTDYQRACREKPSAARSARGVTFSRIGVTVMQDSTSAI
jgi:hypothetical protein